MQTTTYKQIKAIETKNKDRWLRVNKNLDDKCGIYILTRIDENKVPFCYVGQSVNVLTRLAQHLTGYQHIDLSLKKHGLYDAIKNQTGWNVQEVHCLQSELDECERQYIAIYIQEGYQMRNKTLGGQDTGKTSINDSQSTKGYYDGIQQGKKKEREYIRNLFDKYLDAIVKGQSNKTKERKLKEFYEYLEE